MPLGQGKPAAGEEMLLGGAKASPLESAAGVPVVRPGTEGGRIFDNGPVEVLGTLGALAGP
jgi:hypothetical protein